MSHVFKNNVIILPVSNLYIYTSFILYKSTDPKVKTSKLLLSTVVLISNIYSSFYITLGLQYLLKYPLSL